MKYFYVMLFLLVFVCCDKEEVLYINSLKDSGYTEITCKDIDEYENQDTRFTEFNKKLLDKKSFLIARCFDENSCLITMSINKDKVITYCGGGIAATNIAFAITITGFKDITVYDASLNEWAKDKRLPLEN